jgi:hypothetical protein
MYMHVNRSQWAGHVVRLFYNRILEGNLGGRKPTGKPRERQEDEERKEAGKFSNRAVGKTQERTDEENGEVLARKPTY